MNHVPDGFAHATRTHLTLLMQLKSKEERDAIIASGMEDGLQDALGLLEQVAISLDRENLARPVGPDQVLARARSARPTRPKIP